MLLLIEPKKRLGRLSYKGLSIISIFGSMILALYFLAKYLHWMIILTAPDNSPLRRHLSGMWADLQTLTEASYWKPMDYIVMIGSSVSGLEIFVCLLTLCPLFTDLRYGFWGYFVYVPIYLLFLLALTITTLGYYDEVDIEMTVILGLSFVFYGIFEFIIYKWYKELGSISKQMKELMGDDDKTKEEMVPHVPEEEEEEVAEPEDEERPKSTFSSRIGSAFSARVGSAFSDRPTSVSTVRIASANNSRPASAVRPASGSRPESGFPARAASAISRVASALSTKST